MLKEDKLKEKVNLKTYQRNIKNKKLIIELEDFKALC